MIGMSTLLLSAVFRSWMKSRIALTTDELVAVVLSSKDLKRGFNYTTTKTKHQMKRGFLLDIVIGKCSAVL